MSSANVELVQSILAAWSRGEFGSADWADPEIEFVLADGPSPGSWTGVAGMAAANRDWLSAWEDFQQELEECRELGPDSVLVLHRFRGRGKGSGMHVGEMRAEGAALFEIHGGRVVRLVHYFDRGQALADVGLAPDDD